MILLVASQAMPQHSNQSEVRAGIEENGWKVAYGRMVKEEEHFQLAVAVAEGILSDNPAPVLAYFDDFAKATVDRISPQVPEISRESLIEQMKKAMITRGGLLTVGRVDIKFGVATYQHWELEVRREPQMVGWPLHMAMVRVEKRIPLPGSYQPYIGVRVSNR